LQFQTWKPPPSPGSRIEELAVSFLGLFQRELDENELVWEDRAVIDGVRNGQSDADAAQAAGVDGETLRGWKRDPAFRQALRRAKVEGPREPTVHDLRPHTDPSGIPPPGSSDFTIEQAGWRRLP